MTTVLKVADMVYRLVEAQEPEVQEPEAAPSIDQEAMAAKVGEVRSQSEALMKKYDVKHDDFDMGPYTEEDAAGLFVESSVSYGGLEGSPATVTFDWALDFMRDIRNGDLSNLLGVFKKNPSLGMVQLALCEEKFGASSRAVLEGLLEAVASLQAADARPVDFESLPPGEQDEQKLKDWVIALAVQMMMHGVGSDYFAVMEDFSQRVIEEFEQEIATMVLGFVEDTTDRSSKVFNAQEFTQLIKNNNDLKAINPKLPKLILNVLEDTEKRPVNYFVRDKFQGLVEAAQEADAITAQDLQDAKHALRFFKSDQEWADILKREASENDDAVGINEEIVRSYVDDLTRHVGGYKGKLHIEYGEDNKVMVRLEAPAPFMYVFKRAPNQTLELEEAAMHLAACNRVYVATGRENIDNLLEADLNLAVAKKEIAGYEPKKGKGSDAETLAAKIVKQLDKMKGEEASGDLGSDIAKHMEEQK